MSHVSCLHHVTDLTHDSLLHGEEGLILFLLSASEHVLGDIHVLECVGALFPCD